MLLLPAALAAELVPDRSVIRVSTITVISAGEDGTVRLENFGSRPATLQVDRAGFGSGPKTVEVAAGAQATIAVRYDGPCSAFDEYSCVTGSIRLTGPGGTLAPRIQVLPAGMGLLSTGPAQLYWDPTGPIPPLGAFETLGSLAGVGEPKPKPPDLPAGPPQTVKAPHGAVQTGLSDARGAAAHLDGLETALADAALACDLRTGTVFEVSGDVSWGGDGRVSGVRVYRSVGADERCVVQHLFVANVGNGPGDASFRASPAKP